MEDNTSLEQSLAQHRAIRESLPNAWSAFLARFGSLRPIQLAAIPEILKGTNVLLTAPTAGGKTEAVAAPLCERIVRHRWAGLSILLITPTRALVNDLFFRLEKPCLEMGIRLARKTSDHGLPKVGNEQFLITTPESTEALLTFNRQRLDNVRAVVLDEIHLLDGSPRGDQLRFILSRLKLYLHSKRRPGEAVVQSIAMSATLPDPAETAAAYLGEAAFVVGVCGQRDIESRVVLADGDPESRAQQAMAATSEFSDVRKVLVFVNSRKQVDQAGYYTHERFPNVQVYGHHGNLSKDERERTEGRFRADGRAICVATMTMEVGIDIGDVDLIVCMDLPFSLSSFLQRIGRGCRRLDGKTRVLCVARSRTDALLFKGLIRQAQIGIPPGPRNPVRRAVVLQQILAYLSQVDRNRRTFEQFEKALSPAGNPVVTAQALLEALSDMVGNGLLSCRNKVYEPASGGWDFIQSSRIYSNIAPTPETVTLVDADSGKVIVKAAGLDAGASGVRVAGRSFDILPGGSAHKRKVRGAGEHSATPQYSTRSLPYSADVGRAVAGFLGLNADTLTFVRQGDVVIVFTWLGKLQNLCLQALLASRGTGVKSSSFAISMARVQPNDIRTVLAGAILSSSANPLSEVKVECAVDLGPHFKLLSDGCKRSAREDWYNKSFLMEWIQAVHKVRMVDMASELGADLVALGHL